MDIEYKVILIRIGLAFLFGGIIGFERERKGRDAGLRTHILVCMGSALIMLVSLYIYELFKHETVLDPARIAAGVVTGIGFLGAGTIIRSRWGVMGLTTAASIWISAAIGLAVGCGFIWGAFVTTIITFLTLFCLSFFEPRLQK